MNLKTAFWTAITSTALFSLQGCNFLAPYQYKPMSAEQVIQKDKKDQVFKKDKSMASNICQYMPIECPKEIEISRKEFEELNGKINPGKNIDTTGLGATMVGTALVNPSSFTTSTSQLGMGSILFLGSFLFSGGPKEFSGDIFSRVMAFVPVSKAKTAEEAQQYFIKALAEAEDKVIAENGYKVVTNRGIVKNNVGILSQAPSIYRYVEVEGKNSCTPYKGNPTCYFAAGFPLGEINELKTIIPSWLPNGGKEAWRISWSEIVFLATKFQESHATEQKILFQLGKYLPDDFYLYVPPARTSYVPDSKEIAPAFIMSNKQVYPFITIEK